MLGKLIKHEWKSVYKVGCIMLLVVAVITAIGCIACNSPAFISLFEETGEMTGAQVMGVFSFLGSILLYVFMLLGVTYGILIYLGVRFYKSMYSDEGYLANTLPVTRHQLLGSKVIVGGLWYLIVELAVAVSAIALVVSFFACILSASGESYSLWEILHELFSEDGLAELFRMFEEELDLDMLQYMAVSLISSLVSTFAAVVILFGALTIGQLSRKYKVMMGIVAYFVINVVMSILQWVVSTVYTTTYTLGVMRGDYMGNISVDGVMLINLALSLAAAVGLYFASHYILSQKLNLE